MQKGFNRIEILIVFLLVFAAITIFLLFVLDIQKSVRDAKRQADIDTIAKELEVHFNNQTNQFCQNAQIDSYCAPQDGWFDKSTKPTDPLSHQAYLNLPKDGDKKFMICAKLEKEAGSLSEQAAVVFGANSGYYYCSSSQQ